MTLKKILFTCIIILIITSCSTSQKNEKTTPISTKNIVPKATETPLPIATITATVTSTPQPRRSEEDYGIEINDFPPAYNPLTGRVVEDPFLLNIPAVLVSISNIPVSARPQAGPGFASWLFEYYIGEATTRFLGVFYGDYPRLIPNIEGDCSVNDDVFQPGENWLGNRVWLDENEDGVQDDWEVGVGGICVHLYENAKKTQSASTNSNGYYAFNISDLGKSYFVEFDIPAYYQATLQDVGNDDQDSDVDGKSGRTKIFDISSTDASVDLGLLLVEDAVRVTPTPPVEAPYLPSDAYVGPIRSGRLTYVHINKFFPKSCLVFAGAAPDIFAQLNPCKLVYGVDKTTPNSALLTVDEMRKIAADNGEMPNYSGNLFSKSLPDVANEVAIDLSVVYHRFSQSSWKYDPVSQSYLRFTDNADGTGVFHPALDRLTGRQQSFENVIVLQVTHDVFRHNQLDIDLGFGQRGFAYLFRDGLGMKVYWSTENREWEKESGVLRPIHFVDVEGKPIALHPGRTWIYLVTPESIAEKADGSWKINFVQPYDPAPE